MFSIEDNSILPILVDEVMCFSIRRRRDFIAGLADVMFGGEFGEDVLGKAKGCGVLMSEMRNVLSEEIGKHESKDAMARCMAEFFNENVLDEVIIEAYERISRSRTAA